MTSVFGKYKDLKTPIHKLDARIKLFALLAIMVLCFLPYGETYANMFLALGLLSIFVIIIMIISKSSFIDFIKNLKLLWMMAFFLLIINLFVPYTGNHHVMIEFNNGYKLYWEGLLNTAFVMYRLVLMVALTLILTGTTTPIDLTYAFEWYLTPLKVFKFPVQVLAMVLSLALRFIPTLLIEANRIMKAQKSRGVDYNRGFISKKIKSISTLIVPLLISCFSIANDLSLAMDARGYDPYKKRSRYKELKFGFKDGFAIILTLGLLGLFIYLSVLMNGQNFNLFGFIFNYSGEIF